MGDRTPGSARGTKASVSGRHPGRDRELRLGRVRRFVQSGRDRELRLERVRLGRRPIVVDVSRARRLQGVGLRPIAKKRSSA
jgi:hypothetical protein